VYPADLPLLSRVWVGHDAPIEGIQPSGAGSPLPINTLHEVDDGWLVNRQSPEAHPDNTPRIHLRKFGDLNWPEIPQEVRQRWHALLIAVETEADLAALESVATRESTWRLPEEVVGALACVRDACRWSGAPCPATRGLRWIADDEGRLRPCTAGAPMGSGREGLMAARTRLCALVADEQARRGCENCAASDRCSKCLFPAPLGAAEYCELRRARPQVADFVDSLTLARDLVHPDRLGVPASSCSVRSLRHLSGGAIQTDNGEIPLSACLLLISDRDGRGFLHSPPHGLLLELDEEHARILEALSTTAA
jgi:hypothetical protein